MSGGGEYEPQDSRHVVGTKGNPKKSWRKQEDAREGRGEYEPRDARNATDQPSSKSDRWEKREKNPPNAAGTRSVGSKQE